MYTVVYCSKAGSTRSYAEAFATRMGFPCISVDEYKDQKDVIFFGWISGPIINGMKIIPAENISIVCAVGLDHIKPDTIDGLSKKNKTDKRIFYLRGAIDRDKLSLSGRFILWIVSTISKLKHPTEEDLAVIKVVKNGGSFYSIEQLDPLIEARLN